MVRSLVLASLLLAACNTSGERARAGECPAGELCSDLTPYGLHFIGTPTADQIFLDGPGATAIGGTQEISLEYQRPNLVNSPLDLPYRADDDGGLGVAVVTQSGPTVTVAGTNSRSNYLRIVDPDTDELFDRYELSGAAVSAVNLIGTEFELVPDGMAMAWGPGDQSIGIALRGEVQNGSTNEMQRIVDTSIELGLAGSTRASWDLLRLPNATVGSYTVTVTTGSVARTLPLDIVASADAMAVQNGDLNILVGGSRLVCFTASNRGRYVYGLTWQFTVDGIATTHGKDTMTRNCINVHAPANLEAGTIAVVAAAGGAQATVDLTITSSARSGLPTHPFARTRTTEGDRARM